jgi:hypothetical protein
MSPPRRRRRRRGRGEQPEAPAKRTEGQTQPDGGREPGTQARSRGRRRGRGNARRKSGSPFLSEDLVRAAPKERPASLSGPPDGQTLEKLIGDLQSEWGVPQYPQEYRITIKVADERDARSDRSSAAEPAAASPDAGPAQPGPKRERAPAAPRVAAGAVEREAAPKRRRGRRRRRRGRDASGGAAGSPPSTGGTSSEGSPESPTGE